MKFSDVIEEPLGISVDKIRISRIAMVNQKVMDNPVGSGWWGSREDKGR